MSRRIVAGGRLRDRFGPRNPAAVFGALGVALVGASFVAPAFETLLFVWGGTALFVTLMLRFVMTGTTVSSSVATDVYTAMARNARRLGPADDHEYVPDSDGVTLVVGDREFDAVGERLLRRHGELTSGESVSTQLSVLTDALVNDLELATRAAATTDGESATVRVSGSRVGTAELFDHPVASVVGAGLARGLATPVGVETTLDDGELIVVAKLKTSE